jgi:hypothetical protein
MVRFWTAQASDLWLQPVLLGRVGWKANLSPALKAPEHISPGQRPGLASILFLRARKGREQSVMPNTRQTPDSTGVRHLSAPPFTGPMFFSDVLPPRALPWLIGCAPLAREIALAAAALVYLQAPDKNRAERVSTFATQPAAHVSETLPLSGGEQKRVLIQRGSQSPRL